MNNIPIGRRLGLGFAVILFFSMITIIVSINRLNTVAQAAQELLNEPLATERLIGDWYRNIHTAIRRTQAVIKSSDPSLAAFFNDEAISATKSSSEIQKVVE